jgi:hypothetical protein
MQPQQVPTIAAHEARKVAVAAECDPRTVRRVVAGLPTKGLQRERVLRALKDTGLEHLVAK